MNLEPVVTYTHIVARYMNLEPVVTYTQYKCPDNYLDFLCTGVCWVTVTHAAPVARIRRQLRHARRAKHFLKIYSNHSDLKSVNCMRTVNSQCQPSSHSYFSEFLFIFLTRIVFLTVWINQNPNRLKIIQSLSVFISTQLIKITCVQQTDLGMHFVHF